MKSLSEDLEEIQLAIEHFLEVFEFNMNDIIPEFKDRSHTLAHEVYDELASRDTDDGTKVSAAMIMAVSILKRWVDQTEEK